MSADQEREEARLAALVCRSKNLEEQLEALRQISAATPLRLILAYFAVYPECGEAWDWDYDPCNTSEVLEVLLGRINWVAEFIGYRPPASVSEVSKYIHRSKRFQRRVLFLGGFRAPMNDKWEEGEWNDWRMGAIAAIRIVLQTAGRRSVYDRKLRRAVEENPESPDAFLLADSIRANSQVLRLSRHLKRNGDNPDLAQFLYDIADH